MAVGLLVDSLASTTAGVLLSAVVHLATHRHHVDQSHLAAQRDALEAWQRRMEAALAQVVAAVEGVRGELRTLMQVAPWT